MTLFVILAVLAARTLHHSISARGHSLGTRTLVVYTARTDIAAATA
jgi:hypothetical protein